MNPTFLDNMSWEMAEVYGAITDRILINLARYFPYINAGNVPKSSFDYQAVMLAQMGQVNADTLRIIKNSLQGANKALSNVLEQAIIDAVSKAEKPLLKGVQAGILKPAGIPVVAPNQYRAFELYYQQAADKLNLVNTVMLESTKQAYQACITDVVSEIALSERLDATFKALDVAAGETITGVSTWNQALRHAMDKLKDRGITGFIDHAGRRWSAESYVAMDIRSTVYNTGRAAVWETNQNFGNDLYIVSYHDGARPLCYPWQNKVISSTNNAREVADLDGNTVHVYAQSDTSYGEPAGLFGINCKHYPSPFIPGVSVAYDSGNIVSEEQNRKVYEQTQQQRGLERKLREEKRDLLIAKARGANDEEIKALRAKCRQTSDDIDTFCQETGLPRQQNREGVFTKRDFPDADKYDPKDFERKQKDEIEKFFGNGGAQHGYTFGQMTPKEPIIPTQTPTPAPVAPVAQNPINLVYGKPFDTMGYRKPQLAQLTDAKNTLDNAPDNIKKVWSKVANDLHKPSFGVPGVSGAHYSPMYRRTYYKTYKEAFAESTYQRKNTVFYHEYGHNIDHALGGFGLTSDSYLSVSYNGGAFGTMIEQECKDAIQQFYNQSGMTVDITDKSVGKAFTKWVKTTYNLYERSDISDMFERYMIQNYGIETPFDVGHGKKYQSDARHTPIEAFAEMFSATATGNDSIGVIKTFFPKSYKIFEDMIASVI